MDKKKRKKIVFLITLLALILYAIVGFFIVGSLLVKVSADVNINDVNRLNGISYSEIFGDCLYDCTNSTNLIEYGEFTNGTETNYNAYSQITVDQTNDTFLMTSSGVSAEHHLEYNTANWHDGLNKLNPNDVLYVSYDIIFLDNNVGFKLYQWYWNGTSYTGASTSYNTQTGSFSHLLNVPSNHDNSGNGFLRFQMFYNGSSLFTEIVDMELDNAKVFNLTAIFGENNIPTLEQFENALEKFQENQIDYVLVEDDQVANPMTMFTKLTEITLSEDGFVGVMRDYVFSEQTIGFKVLTLDWSYTFVPIYLLGSALVLTLTTLALVKRFLPVA